jgi:hypothetical protein
MFNDSELYTIVIVRRRLKSIGGCKRKNVNFNLACGKKSIEEKKSLEGLSGVVR